METQKQSKLAAFMEEKFVPVAARIGGQRHLLALRDGIIMIMPLLILGAFTMIIFEFPISAEQVLADRFEFLYAWNDIVVGATFGIMAIIAAFGVGNSLAGSYKKKNGESIDGVPAGILSIATFFIINGFTDSYDGAYLFTAIICGIFAAEIYRLFLQKDWVIKLPETVPLAVARQFTALLPGLAIFLISWMAIAVPMSYTEYGTLSVWLNEGVFAFFKNAALTYPFHMIASFLEHLLWCFGLHGSAIVIFPFFEPLWASVTQPGVTTPFTWAFYENNVWLGGSGATLPAVVYMLLFAKSKLMKDIGKIAIGPGLFNINEPFTFGLPVVLNPVLMIPFILSPLAIITIQYFGTVAGLFPIMDKMVPWTTPIFVSGFLAASGGIGERIMSVLAQVICFAASFFIWLPFIRAWDNVNVKREKGIAA